jgi:hypothetical protein
MNYPTQGKANWMGPEGFYLRPSSELMLYNIHQSIGFTHPFRLFTSTEEMLALPELDAVLISTETATHAELALKAIQLGKVSSCRRLTGRERLKCTACTRREADLDIAGRDVPGGGSC